MSSITELLDRWKRGDRSVEDALATDIYPVLRELARTQVRRHGGALTLRATELANEAYERLHLQQGVNWQNRAHFHAIAATLMRRVVVDFAGDATEVEKQARRDRRKAKWGEIDYDKPFAGRALPPVSPTVPASPTTPATASAPAAASTPAKP